MTTISHHREISAQRVSGISISMHPAVVHLDASAYRNGPKCLKGEDFPGFVVCSTTACPEARTHGGPSRGTVALVPDQMDVLRALMVLYIWQYIFCVCMHDLAESEPVEHFSFYVSLTSLVS